MNDLQAVQANIQNLGAEFEAFITAANSTGMGQDALDVKRLSMLDEARELVTQLEKPHESVLRMITAEVRFHHS